MSLFLNKSFRISPHPSKAAVSVFPPESRRHIRIKKADDTAESGTDPAEKDYQNIDGRSRQGPSEAHAADKGSHRSSREGSLDPQAQGAQSSMRDPKSESPSSIHGQLYKGDSSGTGGAERGGQTEAAPTGSWWEAMKHKLGLVADEGENRQKGS